jgi:replicative DNA helicase
MEQEYAAQCRRLAQDWRRLEQHQQDNLATLKLRESELNRQKELLESERELQLSQVSGLISYCKLSLVQALFQFISFMLPFPL